MIDPATIAAQNAAFAREAWRQGAVGELGRQSWKLRLTPFRMREQFADAFLEAVDVAVTEDAARAVFHERVRQKAIPLPVILMLAELVFKILWALWKRRNP